MKRIPCSVIVFTLAFAFTACQEAITTGPTAPQPEVDLPIVDEATIFRSIRRCETDLAIRIVARDDRVHGAVRDSVLHMGGQRAQARCGGHVIGARSGEQESQRSYVTVQYEGESYWRFYVLERDCIIDRSDSCVATASALPADFDVDSLPADLPPIIPGDQTPDPVPQNDGQSPRIVFRIKASEHPLNTFDICTREDFFNDIRGYRGRRITCSKLIPAPSVRDWNLGGHVCLRRPDGTLTPTSHFNHTRQGEDNIWHSYFFSIGLSDGAVSLIVVNQDREGIIGWTRIYPPPQDEEPTLIVYDTEHIRVKHNPGHTTTYCHNL